MTNSKRIAGLLGPALIAVTISETINLQIWATNIAPVVFLNGTLLFVAGLSIVRDHNRWTRGWPVLVTLTGWILLLGGLSRMFAPVSALQAAQNNTAVLASTVVLCVIGIVLTFKGYSREDSKTAAHAGGAG